MKQEDNLFRYQVVAGKIEAMVANLNLQHGERVPSVRKVCKELNVSAATVLHAYSILEGKGAIISRPRSGFFVNTQNEAAFDLKSTGKFIPLADPAKLNDLITNILINVKESGLVNLAISAPANDYLPVSALGKCVAASIRDVGSNSLQYPPIEGHSKLVNQIARRNFDWRQGISTEQILVTNGCMEAINLCLDAVTKAGDTVVIESPTPYGILQSLNGRDLVVIEVQSNTGTGVDLKQLQDIISANKVAACVFTTVCNAPLGSSMSEADIIKLLSILGEANVPLIEDDALGELIFSELRRLPAKAYDEKGLVLYCSSFSKSLGAGFRIGWVSGGCFHEKIRNLKYRANFFTNGILQDGIARFIEKGQYDVYLRKLKKVLQVNLGRYLESIERYFPEEVKVIKPLGGFNIWIELPQAVNGLELTRLALQEGVGIFPGEIFSATYGYENFIRIAYCPVWNLRIDRRIEKLGQLIKGLSIATAPNF